MGTLATILDPGIVLKKQTLSHLAPSGSWLGHNVFTFIYFEILVYIYIYIPVMSPLSFNWRITSAFDNGEFKFENTVHSRYIEVQGPGIYSFDITVLSS